MKYDTIGIVMPTFNSAQYLANSIRSVVSQDYTDWLLFVSDDGSTDDTYDIVHEFMKVDQRIHWLGSKDGHKGVCHARRRGILAANTEWIAFLDSDDIWCPNKLSTQIALAKRDHASFVFTASAFIDNKENLLDYTLHVPTQVGYPEILKQDIISCSSVLIRRTLLETSFQKEDAEVCEDYAAWIRVLRDHDLYAVGIDMPLLQYRLRARSLSANKLQSAYRTFKTYRASGLSMRDTVWAWLHYVHRSIIKYSQIAWAKGKNCFRKA